MRPAGGAQNRIISALIKVGIIGRTGWKVCSSGGVGRTKLVLNRLRSCISIITTQLIAFLATPHKSCLATPPLKGSS
jgi:hypothetical protein